MRNNSNKGKTLIFYARVNDLRQIPESDTLEFLLLPMSTDSTQFDIIAKELPLAELEIYEKHLGSITIYYTAMPVTEREMCHIGSLFRNKEYKLKYLGESGLKEALDRADRIFDDHVKEYTS